MKIACGTHVINCWEIISLTSDKLFPSPSWEWGVSWVITVHCPQLAAWVPWPLGAKAAHSNSDCHFQIVVQLLRAFIAIQLELWFWAWPVRIPGAPLWKHFLQSYCYGLSRQWPRNFCFVLFFNVLATPHGMWDLISPTRDQPTPTAVEVQSLLDRQGSPRESIFLTSAFDGFYDEANLRNTVVEYSQF